MNMLIKGLGSALVGGAWVLSTSGMAHAVTINDTVGPTSGYAYIGGNPGGGTSDNSSWDGRDVVGNYNVFAIHSAEVTQTGDDNLDLTVRINSNFAGRVGTGAALQMDYGALFIGQPTSSIDFSNGGINDTYVGDEGRFQYALDMDYDKVGEGTGSSTLWSLTTVPGDEGKDVLNSTAGGTYRNDQAWKPVTENPPTGKQVATDSGLTGQWTVSAGDNLTNPLLAGTVYDGGGNQEVLEQGSGYIEFVINDFFDSSKLGFDASDGFVFAWAMQCANDIIVGEIVGEEFAPSPVPLPGSLILLLSGLLGIGWLGRSRAQMSNA